MDISNPQRAERPAPQQVAHAAHHNQSAQGGSAMQVKNKKPWVTVVLVVAAVIVLALGMGAWKMMTADAAVKGGQYQALFLTNGQVYFGKLSAVNDKYVTLKDIYYLQVQQTVQPADKSKGDQPQVSLAKLGSELHGPEDEMRVNRDQVLFWENLKNDSKVVDAIKKNQEK